MSEPRKFEITEFDLQALAIAFNKLKPLLDLVLSNEDTAGVCALVSCGLPFIKREAKQRFCCPAHQQKASNDSRVAKRRQLSMPDEVPLKACNVQDCTNSFVFDPMLPHPYRCRECAAKSV